MGSDTSFQPRGQASQALVQTYNPPPPYQPTLLDWNFNRDNTQSLIWMNFVEFKETHYPEGLNHFWLAELEVVNANVAYLMRHGFHWDGGSVQEEKSFLETDDEVSECFRRRGWGAIRYYYLASASDTCADGQWTARLRVFSDDIPNLSGFRIDHLALRKLRNCQAYVCGKMVYNFNEASPAENINVYYDDMPLEGWWPWPRREKDEEGEEHHKLIDTS